MPLQTLIEKNHPNLIEIDDIKQIPQDKDMVITVAAPWCGHCQNEFKTVLNPTCRKLSNTKCLALDGDSENGRKVLQQMGLNLQGFPTNVFCKFNAKTKKVECIPIPGAIPQTTYDEILKKANLS